MRAYDAMVECILESVRQGLKVCVAFYGHPGIFVDPSHRAIRLARSEGYRAVMLPGVSAEDCLFAELGVDPSRVGCASYEATDFLLNHRRFSPTSSLILWQVGVIGDITYRAHSDIQVGIRLLLDRLVPEYGESHEVTIYEGAILPLYTSRVLTIPLSQLPETQLTPISTLYIPPQHHSVPDMAIVASLGLGRYFGQ